MDIQLIEETLLYAMVDEFDTQIDNDSALEIGNLIVKLYRDAAQEKYGLIDEMYEKWQAKQNTKNFHKVHVEDDPNNPDVSSDEKEEDDDDGEEEEIQDDNMMEIDEPEQPRQQNAPIVDDDGFELVQSKGRRR